MPDTTCPPARFQRFEKVMVANSRMGAQYAGQQGTVIWCDRPVFGRREWGYCLSLPALGCWSSFSESDLRPTGEFYTEESQLGTRYEISYDTALNDDMGVVEGSYRLPGRLWQVFLFSNEDVPEVGHSFERWQSGITGVEFEVPMGVRINHDYVVSAMSRVFGADLWDVVHGPDSLVLK